MPPCNPGSLRGRENSRFQRSRAKIPKRLQDTQLRLGFSRKSPRIFRLARGRDPTLCSLLLTYDHNPMQTDRPGNTRIARMPYCFLNPMPSVATSDSLPCYNGVRYWLRVTYISGPPKCSSAVTVWSVRCVLGLAFLEAGWRWNWSRTTGFITTPLGGRS